RPDVEEAGQRVPGVLQVDVLATRLGEARAQFGVGKGADERHEAADRPGEQHEPARIERARHEAGIDEDARPDDAADNHHRRVERAQYTPEMHARSVLRNAGGYAETSIVVSTSMTR